MSVGEALWCDELTLRAFPNQCPSARPSEDWDLNCRAFGRWRSTTLGRRPIIGIEEPALGRVHVKLRSTERPRVIVRD